MDSRVRERVRERVGERRRRSLEYEMTEKEGEDGGGDGNSVKNACGQGGDDWSQDSVTMTPLQCICCNNGFASMALLQ